VQALKAEGIRIVMVTGDHHRYAEVVARQLALEEVMAEVLPEKKGYIITQLKSQGRVVPWPGDRNSDAPLWHWPIVGIAMGTGSGQQPLRARG